MISFMKHTLSEALKKKECTLDDKRLRGANKGITEINAIPNASLVTCLFLSNNNIKSLNGIQSYHNLSILSLAFNEISCISELKLLSNLKLKTLNLEGNPIIHMPYYQHHAVYSIPTLGSFNGYAVTKETREEAKKRVLYDHSRLEKLCFNELKIQELEDLIQSKPKNKSELLAWADRVRSLLDQQEPNSNCASYDEDEDKRFDQMRELALDLRRKQPNYDKIKWSQVYNMIESIQQETIDKISTDLINEISKIQKTPPTKKMSAKKEKSVSRRNSFRKTPPVSTPSPARMQDFEEFSEDEDEFIGTPVPKTNVPQLEKELPSPPVTANSQCNSPKASINAIEQIGYVYEMHLNYRNRSKCFNQWKNQICATNKSPLKITITSSTEIYDFNIDIANTETHENETNKSLITVAQDLVEKNSQLETQLESTQKKLIECEKTLRENMKSSQKMKLIIRQMNKEKEESKALLKETQKKYEADVFELMLKNRCEYEQAINENKDFKNRIQLLETEKATLTKYIKMQKSQNEREVSELNSKLQSAYEVASGFRKEITKMEEKSMNTPISAKNDSDFSSPSSKPTKQKTKRGSPESSPEAFSPDDDIRISHRRRRSSNTYNFALSNK